MDCHLNFLDNPYALLVIMQFNRTAERTTEDLTTDKPSDESTAIDFPTPDTIENPEWERTNLCDDFNLTVIGMYHMDHTTTRNATSAFHIVHTTCLKCQTSDTTRMTMCINTHEPDNSV